MKKETVIFSKTLSKTKTTVVQYKHNFLSVNVGIESEAYQSTFALRINIQYLFRDTRIPNFLFSFFKIPSFGSENWVYVAIYTENQDLKLDHNRNRPKLSYDS